MKGGIVQGFGKVINFKGVTFRDKKVHQNIKVIMTSTPARSGNIIETTIFTNQLFAEAQHIIVVCCKTQLIELLN